MKLKVFNLFNLKTLDELARFVSIMMNDVIRVINGELSFQDNLNTRFVDVSFTAADTEVGVEHGLGRVPTGYFAVKSNAATSVYDSGSTNTATTIYLKASAISEVKLIVF